MPPKSRKRNKGKERKAKKADKVELERANANRFWQTWKENNRIGCCKHGHDSVIAKDHPVSNFLDEFFIHWIRKQKGYAMILRDMLRTHSPVWTNSNHREFATQTFVSIGTNMLLKDDNEINKMALSMAKTIVALEHYDSSAGPGLNSVFFNRYANTKTRDLASYLSSTKRDLLKFYRKRLSCKCLKRMHLEARKSSPKMGSCTHCKLEKERVDLSVCSRCMITHYCSRQCQVDHWHKHEIACDKRYQYNLKQQQIKEKKQQLSVELEVEKRKLELVKALAKEAGFKKKKESEEKKVEQLQKRIAELETERRFDERRLAELETEPMPII